MSAEPMILVIDDDLKLLEAVKLHLSKNGYTVNAAADGREGLRSFFRLRPDLVILDIMMPGVDGWELCARIRELSDSPVIMLTACAQEYEKVKGLKMGADDYLVKPFSLRELEARIAAVLRRASSVSLSGANAVTFSDGRLTIDTAAWLVLRDESPVMLTATERRLLFFLVENAGHIVPTNRILVAVWGPEFENEISYVKLYIWRLRRKIEADPEQPEYLITERGVGYRFAGKVTC